MEIYQVTCSSHVQHLFQFQEFKKKNHFHHNSSYSFLIKKTHLKNKEELLFNRHRTKIYIYEIFVHNNSRYFYNVTM